MEVDPNHQINQIDPNLTISLNNNALLTLLSDLRQQFNQFNNPQEDQDD